MKHFDQSYGVLVHLLRADIRFDRLHNLHLGFHRYEPVPRNVPDHYQAKYGGDGSRIPSMAELTELLYMYMWLCSALLWE
jgi:hypothetical protein